MKQGRPIEVSWDHGRCHKCEKPVYRRAVWYLGHVYHASCLGKSVIRTSLQYTLLNPVVDRTKLPVGDLEFLKKIAMPKLGVKKIAVDFVDSKKKWPDIWVDTSRTPPLIIVTPEWKRQSMNERRARLTHEILHLTGLQHGKKGDLDYNTVPQFDSYSKAVYKELIGA